MYLQLQQEDQLLREANVHFDKRGSVGRSDQKDPCTNLKLHFITFKSAFILGNQVNDMGSLFILPCCNTVKEVGLREGDCPKGT